MATRWIDFAELKRQVSIRDVLARYGILDGLREKKPGKLVGACPIHGGKNGTSFNVDTAKNVFHCFSECGGGNVLDLVMKLEDCSIREAGEKLSDWFELHFDRRGGIAKSAKRRTKPQREHDRFPHLGAERRLQRQPAPRAVAQGPEPGSPLPRRARPDRADDQGVRDRSLHPRTDAGADCHPDPQRRTASWWPTPAAPSIGELADAKGKYRLPDGFKKSFVLFNLHRAAEHADRA